MPKLSKLNPPALAGVIRERTVPSAIAEIKNCYIDGADMIDLHLSCLEELTEDNVKRIISSSKLPILALNYNSKYDWSYAGFDEQARTDSMLLAVKAGAAGVDMQGYSFDKKSKDGFFGEDKYSFTKGNPKEIVTDSEIILRQCDFIEQVHFHGGEVLLSCHPGIVMSSEQVTELALFLEKRNPDIIKIVTKADNEDDLAESIRAMLLLKKEVRTPVSYHANGSAGALSRIINPLLGGQIAFCVDHYNEGSTMEQIDLRSAAAVVENIKKLI